MACLASQGGARSAQGEYQCRSHSRGTPLHTDQGQGLGATPRHQWWVPCWSWLMIVQGRQPVQVSPPVNIPPCSILLEWPALPLASPPAAFLHQKNAVAPSAKTVAVKPR